MTEERPLTKMFVGTSSSLCEPGLEWISPYVDPEPAVDTIDIPLGSSKFLPGVFR